MGAIVWNIVGSVMTPADAEETVSDVFYTLWKNSGKVRDGCLRGYLASIARSRAKNKLRESKAELYLEDDVIDLPDSAAGIGAGELAETLRTALAALSPRDREIMVRHYYLCQTAAAIGEETGMPAETVRTRLKAGRAALRELLSKEDFEP